MIYWKIAKHYIKLYFEKSESMQKNKSIKILNAKLLLILNYIKMSILKFATQFII